MPTAVLTSLSTYGPFALLIGIFLWRLPSLLKVYLDYRHQEHESQRRYNLDLTRFQDKLAQRKAKSARKATDRRPD
jgi:hypothetical protein